MKVVWSWLLELCDLPREISAEEGAALLTSAGLEVEEMAAFGTGAEGVVVAEVVASAGHPKAEKLSLVQVIDQAGGTPTEVVCGAPNVPEPGGRVLWAKPGARLPGGIEIQPKELRGVMSAGMLCSEVELELGDDASGIVVLGEADQSAPLGEDIRGSLGLSGTFFDLAIPANRPDLCGHLGVARELVALVGGKVVPPAPPAPEGSAAAERVKITIADEQACPRYLARLIDGVSWGRSPMWMRERLRACGVRPIANLVDITNYVMLELGQPLHAFDLSTLRGPAIDVRRARDGEKMTTLDDIERSLDAADILICDGERPVALAGVMGGAETEVTENTNSILLESASFDPLSIRKTARRLGLHSEASYRFERGVDRQGVPLAAARAAELIARYGGGNEVPGAVDCHPRPLAPGRAWMRVSRCCSLTGVDISADDARQVFEGLGLRVAATEGDRIDVEVPSWRADLEREVDLIEEVIRIRGFDQVPATLPQSTVAAEAPGDRRVPSAREAMLRAGYSEAITFGFTSPERIASLSLPEGDPRAAPIRIDNPMTALQSVMRTSLWPNLIAACAHNLNHGIDRIALFEIGSVFLRAREGHSEPRHLVALCAGDSDAWLASPRPVDVFDARGALDLVLATLGSGADFEVRPSSEIPYLHPGVAGAIHLRSGKKVGEIGELHPAVRERFSVAVPVFGFALELDEIPPLKPRQMAPIPRHPAVTRDVSFFLDEAIPCAEVSKIIDKKNEPLVERATVLEDYRDPAKVPAGQKGMLWSITYRAPDRTLTDAEVDKAHGALEKTLLSQLSATKR